MTSPQGNIIFQYILHTHPPKTKAKNEKKKNPKEQNKSNRKNSNKQTKKRKEKDFMPKKLDLPNRKCSCILRRVHIKSLSVIKQSIIFSSPEPKAQVSFSDQNLSVVRRCRCCCRCRRKLFTVSSSSPRSTVKAAYGNLTSFLLFQNIL